MAMGSWVITAPVTVPPGTATAVTDGFGTVSWAGPAGSLTNWSDGMPQTFVQGQVIMFDPATTAGAALQAAIGAGSLRAYVQGQDDVGHVSLSN